MHPREGDACRPPHHGSRVSRRLLLHGTRTRRRRIGSRRISGRRLGAGRRNWWARCRRSSRRTRRCRRRTGSKRTRPTCPERTARGAGCTTTARHGWARRSWPQRSSAAERTARGPRGTRAASDHARARRKRRARRRRRRTGTSCVGRTRTQRSRARRTTWIAIEAARAARRCAAESGALRAGARSEPCWPAASGARQSWASTALARPLERARSEGRSPRSLVDRLRPLALLHGLVDLHLTAVDSLAGQRLDRKLPELRVTEQHDRETTRLPFGIEREDDLVDGLSEGIEVRLQGLDRRTRVEIPDIHLEHGHGSSSCLAVMNGVVQTPACALRQCRTPAHDVPTT